MTDVAALTGLTYAQVKHALTLDRAAGIKQQRLWRGLSSEQKVLVDEFRGRLPLHALADRLGVTYNQVRGYLYQGSR